MKERKGEKKIGGEGGIERKGRGFVYIGGYIIKPRNPKSTLGVNGVENYQKLDCSATCHVSLDELID